MTWQTFELQVRKFQVGFMGEPASELVPGSGGFGFHEYPLSCICGHSPHPAEKEIRTMDSAVERRGGTNGMDLQEQKYNKSNDDEYAAVI